MRISDWSSDVCSSDLLGLVLQPARIEPVMGLGEIAPRACRRLLAAHRILRRAGTKGRAISAERAGAIVDHDEERKVERQGRMAERSRCENVAERKRKRRKYRH